MNTLSDIRVLDLSHAIAAPSATNLLASLGAEVIKVERFEGDSARHLAPWAFETFNRNKKSIAVNLKTEAGREVVKKLAVTSDLFIQSFRPGVTDGFGFDLAALTKLNPRMIVVTFSAFGVEGPNSSRRGVEAIVQAESGLAQLQGSVLGSTMYVDETTGLVLANAMLAGLMHRERTGEVRHVETSLFSTALYLLGPGLLEASITGVAMNQELHRQRYPLTGMFETQDSPVYIAVYWDRQWEQLCEILGRPDLLADSRFSTAAARSQNQAALASVLSNEIRKYWQADLLASLDARGILAGAVRDHLEVLRCDQVTATQAVHKLKTSTGEQGAFVRRAFSLAGEDGMAGSSSAPAVGAHTLEILASLGIRPAEAEWLRAGGVVEWSGPGGERETVPEGGVLAAASPAQKGKATDGPDLHS